MQSAGNQLRELGGRVFLHPLLTSEVLVASRVIYLLQSTKQGTITKNYVEMVASLLQRPDERRRCRKQYGSSNQA